MKNKDLRKLNREELLQMMIEFSEEAERALQHEKTVERTFVLEKAKLAEKQAEERKDLIDRSDAEKEEMRLKFNEQKAALTAYYEKEIERIRDEQVAERKALLEGFNQEKAEMRKKFTEQKISMQEKFDKDIKGLKARMKREKEEMQEQVNTQLAAIRNAGTLAEASMAMAGVMEAVQKAAEIYLGQVESRKGIFDDATGPAEAEEEDPDVGIDEIFDIDDIYDSDYPDDLGATVEADGTDNFTTGSDGTFDTDNPRDLEDIYDLDDIDDMIFTESDPDDVYKEDEDRGRPAARAEGTGTPGDIQVAGKKVVSMTDYVHDGFEKFRRMLNT